jgi:hypothetical protein
MTFFMLTEEQAWLSIMDARVQTNVSLAIDKAVAMAVNGGCNLTVVNTRSKGICIYSDYQLMVAKDEIIERIYSTDDGFIYRKVA